MASYHFSCCRRLAVCAALLGSVTCISTSAGAEQWSDTYIGYRTGSKFAEPYGTNDIHKNILNLGHVGGYKYGTNFFNVDLLMSDSKDPDASGTGAQEAYVVYRNTIDLSKVTSGSYKFGPIRGMGITLGFDWNTKNDAGYASKKRMLVLGPTFMMDVPGFLNIDLLLFRESNAPNFHAGRYTYDTHLALGAAWGIPLGELFSFEGFALYIDEKGKLEGPGSSTGLDSAAETNIDMQVMMDVGKLLGGTPKTFKAGLEYQYWKNKFGNKTTASIGPGAGPGATAKTPMVRVEYHF